MTRFILAAIAIASLSGHAKADQMADYHRAEIATNRTICTNPMTGKGIEVTMNSKMVSAGLAYDMNSVRVLRVDPNPNIVPATETSCLVTIQRKDGSTATVLWDITIY